MSNLSLVSPKREEVLRKIKKQIEESGMFSDEGINRYMSMLNANDPLLDVELSNMFLIRDGMKRHSYQAVVGFIRQLPLDAIAVA